MTTQRKHRREAAALNRACLLDLLGKTYVFTVFTIFIYVCVYFTISMSCKFDIVSLQKR